jgi:hypothetical protein
MQPTRPVVRAPHTTSTTSLRRRLPQAGPPAPGEPDAEGGAREPAPVPMLEPSAVRLEDADRYPTPIPATPPPPTSLAPLPDQAIEAEPAGTAPVAAPPPETPTVPVVRMAGPVRVKSSAASRAPGETAPRTRPLAPVRIAAPADARPAGEARRVELGPKERGLGFGRFTRVEMRGRSFVVLTEAAAKPQFTVTTVITEKGVPLRKLETALPHPLAREEDAETVRRQLDLQHDEVLQRMEDLVLDGARRRVVWSDQSRSVDGALLAWAISAVAQLAEAEIGTEETARQLHLTRERALVADDVVRAFQITPAARVVLEQSRGVELPRRAVRALGAWCHDFATSALLIDDSQLAEPVRQATRRHGDDLTRIGFYDRLKRRTRA